MDPIYGDNHPTDLSPPAEREEVHNRRISVNGFVRVDGNYDIEGELTDHKTYAFDSEFRGQITPDSPVHHMKIRITITPDLEIVAAEAVTLAGPYAICPTANDIFDNLVGLQIGPGWRRKVAAAIGGRHGCTHITELLGPVATIAYQTRFGEAARQRRIMRDNGAPDDGSGTDDMREDALANSCVAYATD
jgi:hypothetical protein